MQQEKTTALPGLVKIFLGLAYLWMIGLFFSFLGLCLTLRNLGGEGAIWAFVIFGIAACSLVSVIGIHSRAVWAPAACRALCFALIAAHAVFAVRVAMTGASSGLAVLDLGYYDGGFSFILSVPALYAATIPFLIGWIRYFGASAGVRTAFNAPAPAEGSKLPPLGVGLLRVLCGMYLAAVLALILSIFIGASLFDNHAVNPGGITVAFLVVLCPSLIFPAVLLVRTGKPGGMAATVCSVLWVWAISASFLGIGIWIKLVSMLGVDISALIPLYYAARSVPFYTISLAVFAAALSWRFLSSPEEGAWLRQPAEKGVALYSRLPLLAFLALWMAFNYAPFTSHSLLHAPFGILVAAFTVVVAGSWLDTGVPYRLQQNKNVMIFVVLLVAISALFIIRLVNARNVVATIAHFSDRYCINAGLCIYALAILKQKRIDSGSPLAMPLPAGAMYVLCVCVLASGVFSIISGAYSFIAESGRESSRYGAVLAHPGFWIGSFVCPLIMLSQFKRKVPSVSALVTVCIVWLAADFSSEVQSFFTRDGGNILRYQFSRGWQALSAILVLFAMYAAHAKEFAAWRGAKKPSAAVPPVS